MDDPISLVFAALADPTRRAMLARLAEGQATVNELAAPFGSSQPTITKHLKVLERAGLISSSIDAQRRPRRMEGDALKPAIDWLSHYRDTWAHNYDRLDAVLYELQRLEKLESKGEDK